jgi:hypothetical protein
MTATPLWRSFASDENVARLTGLFRTPRGSQTLRAAQAAAVMTFNQVGGLFLNGRVGVGKTLSAGLIARIVYQRVSKSGRHPRVLYCASAGALTDTRRHLEAVREHWNIAPATSIVFTSYTKISNLPAKETTIEREFFGGAVPDLLILDESDNLRNLGRGQKIASAVAAQIDELVSRYPDMAVFAATATSDTHGMLDYAHILRWALKGNSPLPSSPRVLQRWVEVVEQGARCKPDVEDVAEALGLPLAPLPTVTELRRAFRARLDSTLGIILEDAPFLDVQLRVTEVVLPTDSVLEPHFERLRDLQQRPDGIDLAEGSAVDQLADAEPDRISGLTVWSCARRMARGACYIYRPVPPQEWLDARKAYYSWVSRVRRSGDEKTELTARRYAERMQLPEWTAWRDIKDRHAPSHISLWLSQAPLEAAITWGRAAPGLIFVDDPEFGQFIADRAGWKYYGAKGRSKGGGCILDAPAQVTAVASRIACGVGLNLQHQWHRLLITAPPPNAAAFEQNVGRLHREGQANDVEVTLWMACLEDMQSRRSIVEEGARISESLVRMKTTTWPWPTARRPQNAGRAWK